ncbi:hypothetical protein J6590_061938 [Homalodisca vitripennis]|nr:hypothetical protein J6590_061938 [Homalodisca vitripennis]
MTQPQGVPEQMYDQLKACINEAAKEALGEEETKRNGRKSYWWSEEIRGLVEEKKKLYLTWLSTSDDQDRQVYRRCCYLVKKEVKKLKNDFWDRKCLEIDSMIGGSKSKAAWDVLKNLRKKQKRMIDDRPYRTRKLEEFKEIRFDKREVLNPTEPISAKEVKEVIRKMKGNKAPGPEGVPVELYKHAPEVVIEYLVTLDVSMVKKYLKNGK